MLKGKSKATIDEEVIIGLFPPYVFYKILYTLPEKRRVMPTLLEVDLHGADRPLTFSCRLYEAESEFLVHICLWLMYIQNSVFNNDLSASCACTLGRQPHEYSTSTDKLFKNRLKW